jgi:hypothetical protein
MDDYNDFDLHLYTDRDQVRDPSFCEVPIRGPGFANTLVTITGIALSGTTDNHDLNVSLDVDTKEITPRGKVHIHTNYYLDETDQWKGIAGNGEELLQATTAFLTGLVNDDVEFLDVLGPSEPVTSGFSFGLDSVSASVKESEKNRIVIDVEVGLSGDSTLAKIAYQANILIQKANPPTQVRVWPLHHRIGVQP